MQRSRVAVWRAGLVLLALALLQGCHRHATAGAPAHSTVDAVPPAISSRIAIPVSADLASLQRVLDQQIPRELWSIDQDDATCAPPQRIKLFGAHVAVTPKLKCRIVGSARRGDITLNGQGQTIRADVPIIAEVHVQKLAGVIGATATGTAMAHVRIHLNLARDWQASGTAALDYDWQTPPTIDILGQPVSFTAKADEKLRPIVARLQRQLPAELAKLDLREKVGRIWAKAFTVVQLNDHNPPVWMRIVPQKLSYGGYDIEDHRLILNLGMTGLTQAIVGQAPPPPPPSPLPAMTSEPAPTGQVQVFAPVLADYAELEPVIARALTKRSARPFNLPGIGEVRTRFDHVQAYGASGGRVAIGADVVAQLPNALIAPTHGRIWFAAVPHNAPGSQVIHFSDLVVTGSTDRTTGNLALDIANSPAFSQVIADALDQNITRDYGNLLIKVRNAIEHRRLGDFLIDARLEDARNGEILPFANGLYMPVWLDGHASVRYDPR